MKLKASLISKVFLLFCAGCGESKDGEHDVNNYYDYVDVGKPTLPVLLKYPPLCSKPDCINIPLRIGQAYWQFGILLLWDNTGNIIETIEYECQKNAEKINLKILKKWINGSGLPVTWDTLIEVLRDIELHDLADKIVRHRHS